MRCIAVYTVMNRDERARVEAAIYCRISQDRTGEELGVDRQEVDCRALVAMQGWTLYDVYVDNDMSASTGKRRPGYERMLADVEAGHVQAVVAWATERLYRKVKDLEPFIEILEKHGTLVRTVKAGEIDLSTAYGRMIARILASVTQGEGEVKSERWRRSITQRREQGRMPGAGTRMYGWERDGTVIPEEAAVTRRVAESVLAGESMSSIARSLAADDIKTSLGSPWQNTSLRAYLLNPRLAGHSTLNGDIVGKGEWEPILDEQTWETVRAMIESRTRGPKGPRVSLLLGILRCGECGTPMQSATRTDPTKGKVRMYRCPRRLPRYTGCGKISGDALPIEEAVEAIAKAVLADPEVVKRTKELQATTGASEILSEIAALEARLLELDAELSQPGVPVSAITRAIGKTKDRLAECQRSLAAAQPVAIPSRGGAWPSDLQRRRRLIEVALDGRPVLLNRAGPARGFDSKRVVLGDRPD